MSMYDDDVRFRMDRWNTYGKQKYQLAELIRDHELTIEQMLKVRKRVYSCDLAECCFFLIKNSFDGKMMQFLCHFFEGSKNDQT